MQSIDTKPKFFVVSSVRNSDKPQEKLPALKDVIKSLKDGMYPVLRVAYLFNFDYYILESDRFKLNVYPKYEAEFCAFLKDIENANYSLWIYIEGMNHQGCGGEELGSWKAYSGEKAATYRWEGKDLQYIPVSELKLEPSSEIVF